MPRSKRLLHPELPHHVTARANNREHFPVDLETAWPIFENQLFLLKHGFGCEIISFVLMPNHFHLLLRDPNLLLGKAMQYFMRETSKEMNRQAGTINRIWGSNYHSSLIRSLPYYYTAYKYVYQNPLKAGLCKRAHEYEYSTLRGLVGQKRLLIPVAEDPTLFDSVSETLAWLDEGFSKSEEDAIKLSLRKSEMTFSLDRLTRRPIEPSGLVTHPRYQKV